MKGQVNQPNPYGYDEWNEGEDISRQSAQSTAGFLVELAFPVDAPVGAWCKHLLGGEEGDHLHYLEQECKTPLSSLQGILKWGIVPSPDVLTDIAQALRITEQQLLGKPPSSIHEVSYSIMYTHSKRMNISGFDYQEGEYSSVHEGHSSGKIWWGTVDYQVLLRESAVVRRTQENRIVPVRGGRHNRSRVSTAFKGIPTEFLTIGRGENPVMFSLGHIPDSSPLPKASG